MAGDDAVRIRGLAEFRRELRHLLDADTFAAELKSTWYEIATHVADVALDIAAGVGPQQVAMAEDLAPRKRQTGAVIGVGARGRTKDWALGAEFGAIAHPQFPPWRGNQWSFAGLDVIEHETGYALHPAMRQEIDEIERLAGDGIERVASRAFPD